MVTMHYADGSDIQLGDIVDLVGMEGTVVAVLDTREFSPDYPAESWSYLTSGVLILTSEAGLVRCPAHDEDLRVVRRSL